MNYSRALYAHLLRCAAEDAEEHFTEGVDWRALFQRYAEGSERDVSEPGWTRVWSCIRNGKVVAHASLLDMGDDQCVAGQINVERPYRGWRIAGALNEARFAWLDLHQKILVGPVARGNDTAFHAWRRAGYQFSYYDSDTGSVWLSRHPRRLGKCQV